MSVYRKCLMVSDFQSGATEVEYVLRKDYDTLLTERDALRSMLDVLEAAAVVNYNVWCEQMAALRLQLAEWGLSARLAEIERLLPKDSDMIEYNPDEGMSLFCCGGKVIDGGYRKDDYVEHESDCWFVAVKAAARRKNCV